MLKLRFALIFIVAGMVSLAGQAQTTNTIKLGKHEVHPTRILAKYKTGVTTQSRASGLAAANMTLRKQLPIVNGLVVLEANGLPAQAAPQGRAGR